jgi:acyl-ACP thioesterase
MEPLQTVLVEKYTVPIYQVDFDRKITLPNLFLLLQEAAWKHAHQHGYGYVQLQEKGLFWVLAKIKLMMHRYPAWGDTLRLETWGKEPELLTAFRDFEGFDDAGAAFFSATSAWHILSAAGNRPQPMDDFRKGFPIAADKHAIVEHPAKIPAAKNPQTTAPATVFPGDIDMNLHVNNTRYIQWVLDRFAFGFLQQHDLREIEVNFLQQAKVGDQYTVATGAVSDTEFISSVLREDDHKELARIRTLWVRKPPVPATPQ